MWRICTVLALAGCTSNRQEVMQEHREKVGIEAGQPTQVVETVTRSTKEETQAGIDIGKVVQASVAALKGDLLGALEKMKPASPSDVPMVNGTTGTLAGGLAGAALIAFQQFMAKRAADERERQARQDALDEYNRANEAHTREVELAKQLPPPKA